MKLTPEQIQFIDRYLINSNFYYVDVRMELIDHVATSVEEDMSKNGRTFYEAFKSFMVRHKKDLQNEHETLGKKLQLKSFKWLLPILKKPWMMGLQFLFILLLLKYNDWFGTIFPYQLFLWGTLGLTLLVYGYFRLSFRKSRFSKLEAVLWPLSIGAWSLHLIFNLSNFKSGWESIYVMPLSLFTMLFTAVSLATLVKTFQLKSHYQSKYQSA